jgi:hypothetical protein
MLATRYAPSFRLVAAHLGLGLLGLVGFSAALLWRAAAIEGHFFQPTLLGLVHLCVLGWLLPIAIGALHQLIPVVFEVPVRSERLAWAALALYVPGAAGFVTRLWSFDTGWVLVVSAGLVAAAVWLYAANLLATLARAQKVTLTGAYVIAALGYLMLAAAIGFALAWNLHRPYLYVDHVQALRAHAHAAGLGFFGLLIMGVAYRLLEMFLLAYVKDLRPGWVAFVAINVALAALTIGFVFGRVPALTIAGTASAAVGVGAFLVQVRRLWRARTRRRADTAWRHSAASFAYLALAVALGATAALAGLAPAWTERIELAYGVFAIPGFIGSIVVGQLYKIAPFLVWFHRFSAYVGLKQVPAASELLAERPQRVQWALMHAGIAAMAAGILAGIGPLRLAGAALFLASSALFARNVWIIYRSKP